MPLDRAFERLKATGFLVPSVSSPSSSTLSLCFHVHKFCAFHHMASHRTDYYVSLHYIIQDLIDNGAVSFPISTTDTNLGPDMTVNSFPSYSTHAILPPSGLYHHVLDTQGTDIHKTLWYCRHCRCILGLNFSWPFAPITLTTIYEMMIDLTRRIERIELILSEYPSSSRWAPGVVTPSLPHLTSPIFVT